MFLVHGRRKRRSEGECRKGVVSISPPKFRLTLREIKSRSVSLNCGGEMDFMRDFSGQNRPTLTLIGLPSPKWQVPISEIFAAD